MRARPWFVLGFTTVVGCASSGKAPPQNTENGVEIIRHVDRVAHASSSVPLAGTRCRNRADSCRCRATGQEAEADPPAEGQKRFEIRLSADRGEATLESATLGRFKVSGPQEACFYLDVPGGSQHEVLLVAGADRVQDGFSPQLRIAEYGPRGPWWYDIVAVECRGPRGACNREGVDAWAARTTAQRRRGRLEPCGSAVVSQLKWDTSGGLADRDGGHYRDLTVRFAFEVKKFPTQFEPGSTECVPK